MSKKIVNEVIKLSEKYLNENSLELVKVTFTKEGPHRYLRILLDKETGVNLEDCQSYSRYLNKNLNDNIIKDKYFLEVSSPGIERELYDEKDFERFTGSEVDVKLYQTIDGRKIVTGILKGFNESVFKVETADELVELQRSKVSKINLHVNF
ncbi:ribosome maturation factor RimP [Clostridiaceae bacterium HSG29]|nr:ribosome maturation factor RimP [Clostridiaceae bacterium HSG29]